ncbi:hypothetical protein OUZ56_015955 [Daphnia magna]|uniref:Uncharacterized protein n=1 Tax=Daphnia magna TaxID=35525 RepID=A0ABR0AP86_9CRUS|nr:hypothetical protein OUZ56_015955 [Daphnia magna]
MCFKGFFVKYLRLLFVRGVVSPCQLCQRLNQQPAFLLSISPSSSINNRVFIYFVLLTISPQHPRYPDFQVSLISQPSSIPFSSSLWLLFLSSYSCFLHRYLASSHGQALTTSPFFWTANIHLPSSSWPSFAFISVSSSWPSSPSSPSRRLGRLRLHLRLVVLAVFAFISVSSSWPSSPSSPSRRLGRLRLHLRLVVLAVYFYAITSSPASPSPFT